MRTLITLLCLSASAWAQADRDVDLVATLGGRVRELRAVLGLNPAQEKDLAELFESLKKDSDEFRAKVKDKGADAVRPEFEKWQDEARAQFIKMLTVEQQAKFAAYRAKKKRLSEEFDKALFGIPPVTELKLRVGLEDPAIGGMAAAADAAVDAIRKKVSDLRKDKAKQEDLSKAVNEERKSGIEKMIAAAPAGAQPKIRQYIKDYLRTPVDKLAKADHDKLDRTLKMLDLKDPEKEKSAQRLVAAILMHRAEEDALRKGMAKDLVVLILTKKNEAEMWQRMNEYQALIDIHGRRLKDLYNDAKSVFTSAEIAKLVSEGVIE